jgi:murein DD-endopeptidase MepM/ murein hydrolase activator NlpD
MRMRAPILAVTALVVAAPAAAAQSGGAAAPAAAVPAAKVGGTAFSAARVRSVAGLSVGGAATHPAIRVRFAASGLPYVDGQVVVSRSGGPVAARIRLHHVRANRTIAVRWPARVTLRAGRYVIRATAGGMARRTTLVVPAAPARRPAVTPPHPVAGGVFPVDGPHTYGDPFGAPRKGYTHQGQDVLGAEGLPIVAPLGGTIFATGDQPSAAGYYVVLNAGDGHAYFFAHCEKGSTAVATGQVVGAGTQLCRLGQTGDATGPHLHFEEWVGGWHVSSASRPIDPLPQLRAWDR